MLTQMEWNWICPDGELAKGKLNPEFMVLISIAFILAIKTIASF